MCYKGSQQKKKKEPQFGWFSETRKPEVGITSNRRLARYGEMFFTQGTHRPSRSENSIDWKMKDFFKIVCLFLFRRFTL